jgi:hypothetical protein
VTDGEDRERGGLDTDDVRRSLMEALGPVAAALGGSLVDEGELDAADIPLMHVDDAMLDANGRVDPRKLMTVARLGGDFWCHTSDLFEQKRP